MKIDVRANDVLYVELSDGTTIYIDNSTGERIVEVWNDKD
jgi:hypothetical protein